MHQQCFQRPYILKRTYRKDRHLCINILAAEYLREKKMNVFLLFQKSVKMTSVPYHCVVILLLSLFVIAETLPLNPKTEKLNSKQSQIDSSSTKIGSKSLVAMTSQSETRSDPSDSVTIFCPTQKCIEQIKLFIASHPNEGLVLLGGRWQHRRSKLCSNLK